MKSYKLSKELRKQIQLLSNLARKYGIAVIITNQIYSAFDDDGNNEIRARPAEADDLGRGHAHHPGTALCGRPLLHGGLA